jgi:predicted hotdog family 3-hydroxylacyl-ACP dehydratase
MIPDTDDDALGEKLRAYIGRPVSYFVLHRDHMLLLDTLVDIGAGHASCEWKVEDSAFFQPELGVPSYIGIEHMAQSIATLAGARARLNGQKPPLGFLVGTRHFRTSLAYFAPGETYLASCRVLVRDSRGMASFECDVRRDDERVMEANLSVLEVPRS